MRRNLRDRIAHLEARKEKIDQELLELREKERKDLELMILDLVGKRYRTPKKVKELTDRVRADLPNSKLRNKLLAG